MGIITVVNLDNRIRFDITTRIKDIKRQIKMKNKEKAERNLISRRAVIKMLNKNNIKPVTRLDSRKLTEWKNEAAKA